MEFFFFFCAYSVATHLQETYHVGGFRSAQRITYYWHLSDVKLNNRMDTVTMEVRLRWHDISHRYVILYTKNSMEYAMNLIIPNTEMIIM